MQVLEPILNGTTPQLVLITDDFKKRLSAQAVPGVRFDHDLKAWYAPLVDDRAALIATRLFPDVRNRLPQEQRVRIDEMGRVGRFDGATPWAEAQDRAALLPNTPDVIRDTLYDFQFTDLAFITARMKQDGGGYLGWDRGLGKTLGALTAVMELGADHVIIVTPGPSKQLVWVPQIAKWDPDGRWEGRVYDVGKTKKSRDRAVAAWNMDGGILLCHYEALRLLPVEQMHPTLVICDEAHRLAGNGYGTKIQFCKALTKLKSKYRLALSGSVIVNSPEDFFGANYWLFPHIFRSRWRDWNDAFLEYVDGGYGKVLIGVRPDRLTAMQDCLSSFMTVRYKDDELPGLPDKIVDYLRVDMLPEQRRIYDDLAERFMAELPDGQTITTANVLSNLTALRKIATGLGLDDSAKIRTVVEMCKDNLPHKTVVFAWHRDTVDEVVRRLTAQGVPADGIHGNVTEKERIRIVDSFQTCDEPRVLVATIKTLGESVDLTAAADLIFIESSWTSADMEQATDRVYRNGQNRRVTVTHVVARDTVDDLTILPRVVSKADMRRMIMGGGSD